MVILFVIILAISLYNVKFKVNGFHDDFMGKDQCNSVKGIFIMFVFVRHILQYVTRSGYDYTPFADAIGKTINTSLSQFIVVMFLFYSGFGVAESTKKKNYISNLPVNRILPTLINFDIAVCWFVILNLLLGLPLSVQQGILSFLAWDDVGNSNWYIFVIIVCYFFAYIAYKLPEAFHSKTPASPLIIHFFLSLFLIFILAHCKGSYWYNTVLSFVAGMCVSVYKDKFFPFFKKHYVKLFLAVIAAFTALLLIHKEKYCLRFNIESILFALIVVFLTMKIKIQNFPLAWMGAHLFPLYIYQRIPMIAIYEIFDKDFVREYAYLYILISFVITLLIAYFYKHWQIGPLLKDKTANKA